MYPNPKQELEKLVKKASLIVTRPLTPIEREIAFNEKMKQEAEKLKTVKK